MNDLATLRAYWIAHAHAYGQFATHICQQLDTDLRKAGIAHEVSARAKSMDSLLTKAVRKGYTDPVRDITDKAGARVVLRYQDDIEKVTGLIRDVFAQVGFEDKRQSIRVEEFLYQGVHCQVRLRAESISDKTAHFSDLECEIQIQTAAQHLWSAANHELNYKSNQPVPDSIQRQLYRLVALMEIFDNEVCAARRAIESSAGFEVAKVLQQVTRLFYRYTAHQSDRELSRQALEILLPLYGNASAEQIIGTLGSFANDQADKLTDVYRTYERASEADIVFLHQPESLLIFDRLEADEFSLIDTWVQSYPLQLLERVALVWGKALQ